MKDSKRKHTWLLLLVGLFLAEPSSAQEISSCRERIVQSRNQYLSIENLNTENVNRIFLSSTAKSQCEYYANNYAVTKLTEACLHNGVNGLGLTARAQIKFDFVVGSKVETVKTYTAYCQDLLKSTKLYYCKYWDKAQNLWVTNPDPICQPDAGGGPFDDGGGSDIGGP